MTPARLLAHALQAERDAVALAAAGSPHLARLRLRDAAALRQLAEDAVFRRGVIFTGPQPLGAHGDAAAAPVAAQALEKAR